MTIEEYKQTVEHITGVPASLLTGETTEEVTAQVKALFVYINGKQSTAEQFANWFKANSETDPEENREVASTPEPEPAKKMFMEWMKQHG